MADLESNIRLNVDTTDALASLKALQGQISQFQRQMARTSAANADSARRLRQGLVDDINATGRFSASMATIRSTSETFTNALEKNKLSLGEYFRYAGASTKTFGRLFKQEYDTIGKVARERVKDLQTQYIALGRDAGGALKGLAVRPLRLDMEQLGTQTALTAQRQQIFNQLLRQGSTNLLNFGKNTQWAGRQLMVGFTIPLSIFGGMASKTFMEIEEQAIRFRRVYGDAMTTAAQTDEALQSMRTLATEFTKYGVEISKTIELAADAAQMGLQGADLREQVANATRLAVLGEVEQQEALKTSVALTNTFGIATQNLADKINFLNIVENETMTAISDLTIAIPKAGPAVTQLGGSVEDLTFFLTAMKEGGINASEGANALKSGLASIINPTRQSVDLLKLFNVNITEIRDSNRGDIKGLFFDLAEALDALDPGQRAQAIEQLFGKFQFSRISTLLQNVVKEGSQAQRVLELTNATTTELAQLSDRELRRVEESTTFRFRSAVEQFQEAIAPIGEEFLKLITPLIEFGTKIANAFNNMSDNAKAFVTGLVAVLGGLGPILIMTFGLLANGVANIIKGFAAVRSMFLGTGKQSQVLGEQLDYMNSEQLQAAAVAASLDQTHSKLIQTFTSETSAVKLLTDAYTKAWKAQQQFDTGRRIAGGFAPGQVARGYADGGLIRGPGNGTSDSIPAMVSNGEFIVSAKRTQQYLPLLKLIADGKVPGYKSQSGASLVGGGTSTSSSSRAIASHFDILSPQNLAGTLSQATDQLRGSIVELFTVIESATGKGYEVVRSQVSLAEAAQKAAAKGDVMYAGGAFYGGTAAVGPSDRNEMFNRIGVSGEPFTLDNLIAAADRAQLELDSNSEASRIWSKQLHELVAEGEQARVLLAQSNDAEEAKIRYMRENAKKSIEEALLADKRVRLDGKAVTAETASQEAERRLLALDQKLAELKTKGISTEQRLQEAQNMLIAEMLGASTGQFTTGPGTGYGSKAARDVTRNMIRTRGPQAVQRPDFKMPYRGAMAPVVADAQMQQLVALGEDLGTASTKAIASGAKKALQMASPSKEMRLIGENAGQSFADGARSNIAEAAAAGESVGQATVNGITRVGRRRVTTNPNAIPVGTQTGAAKRPRRASSGGVMTLDAATGKYVLATSAATQANRNMATETNIAATAQKRAGISLGTMNSLLMNGTFALTSLAGAGMFMGGAIGDISNKIFAASGLLFGLMQVVQMLTAAKIAELTATRLSVAKQAMAFATYGKGIAAGKGLASMFARAGIGIKAFLGPVGIAITALTALGAIAFFVIDQEKKKQAALEAFGKTANLATEQLDYLASKFGVTANAVDFSSPITPGQEAETGPTPGQLRADEQFLKTYEAQIESLKNSTNEEAIQQLEGMAMQLDAQGFAASTIQTITTALMAEAGKGQIPLRIFKTDSDGALQLDIDPTKTIEELRSKISAAGDNLRLAERTSYGVTGAQQLLDSAIASGVAYTTSALQQLRGALQSGELGAKEYQDSLSTIFDPILDLEGDDLTDFINTLATSMEIDVSGLTNDYDKVLAAKAAVAGVEIPAEDVKILNMGGKEAVEIRKELIALIEGQADAIEETTRALEEQAVIDERIAAAKLGLIDQNALLKDQIEAYNILIAQGYSIADAITYATQAELARGIVTKGTLIDQQEINRLIKENMELNATADKLFKTPSGANEKSPLQLAIESLKGSKAEVENTLVAFNRLRDSGVDIADALRLAEDSTVAAGIASTKVGTKAWSNLLSLINQTNAALQAGAVKELLRSQAGELDLLNQQTLVSNALSNLGYSYEQIQTVLSNNTAVRQLAEDLEDGKIELVESIQLLENFQTIAEQGVNLNFTTKEGAAQEFQKLYDKAVGYLEAQKTTINVDFEIATAEDQSLVTDAQNQIAAIEFEIDDLDAQLRGIEEQEKDITDTYDKRIEALEEVEKLNENIAAQQKAQLTIADALSQGDIAAAAVAAQEMRKEQAQQSIERQRESLDASKEQAIAAIRSADGRSRIEIENEIKLLKDEIFRIEENTLEPANDRIRLAAVERDAQIASLDAQILKWDALSAKVNEAKLKLTDEEMQAMKDQAQIIADMLANWDKIEDRTATLTVIKKTQGDGGGSGGSSSGSGGGPTAKEEAPKTFAEVAAKVPKGLGIAELTPAEMEMTAPMIASKVPTGLGIAAITDAELGKKIPASVKKAITKSAQSKVVSAAAPRMIMLASGGMVPGYYADGGYTRGTDRIPAMLTPGEFVVSKYGVQKAGLDKLKAINSGTNVDGSVYNYNLEVNVKSDSNPNEIARVVMGQIKQVESQRLRSNRF